MTSSDTEMLMPETEVIACLISQVDMLSGMRV